MTSPPLDYYNRPPKELAGYKVVNVDDGDDVLAPLRPCAPICGAGSPEGVVTARIGTEYWQSDSAATSHPVWVKRTGTSNTGWHRWAGLRGGAGAATSLAIGDLAAALGAADIAIGEAADTGPALNHPNIAIGSGALIGTAADSASPTASLRGGHVVIGEAALADMGPSAFPNVIIGREAKSRGRAVVAIGHLAEARAVNTPVSGQVEGRFAVLIGYLAKGSGGCIVSVGDQTDVRGDNTVALGSHARANDNFCTAVGNSAWAGSTTTDGTGTNAIALGGTAKGQHSLALGSGQTLAKESVSIGRGASTADWHHQSIAIGADADSTVPRQIMFGSVDNPLFTVHFNGSPNPALLVDVEGNITLVNHQTSTVVQPVTANTTLTPTEPVLLVSAQGAARTITMPPATGSGIIYMVRKIDTSANTVTIVGDGSDTIDGGANYVLTVKGQGILLEDAGGDWLPDDLGGSL